jgi:hypothetical protein
MTTRRTVTLDTLTGQHTHLETRVATVEANLGAMSKNLADLTVDVRDLSQGVREQGRQFDDQMKQLLVAVTQAQGPRKTDWHLLLGAIGLILAIGAAAFSPLMLRIGDTQVLQEHSEARFERHTELTLHPVGAEKIRALEARFDAERDIATIERRELAESIRREYEKDILVLQNQVDSLRDYGPPLLRERLAVLEGKGCVVDKMAQLFQDKVNAQPKP